MKLFAPLSVSRTAPALALLGLLGLASCDPTLEDAPAPSKGTVDFTKYVAVGNSLTAGFGSNGLSRAGQLNSYPAILAQQFASVGGGEFKQPLFGESEANGSGYLQLNGFTAAGSPILAYTTTNLAVRQTSPVTLFTEYTGGEVNNLGVPGIRLSEIETRGLGSNLTTAAAVVNPYFERITPDANQNQTYLERITAAKPTFFTYWLGNNDVLGFATSGGALSILLPGKYGITTVASFTDKTNKALDSLTANGAKGVAATIPDVTNIPFFTTVGPALKANLTTAGVTGMVATTGQIAVFAPNSPSDRITFAVSDIRGADGTGKQLFTLTGSAYAGQIGRPNGAAWRSVYNQLKAAIPSLDSTAFYNSNGLDFTKPFGVSAQNPWPSIYLLDDAEQAQVLTATTAFNSAIATKATAKGLAVFDANTFFKGIAASGYAINGTNKTAAFISGNLFSLDGVHPTPRGYAVVANEIINVINAKYNAVIPKVNPLNYPAVTLP